MLRDTPTSAEIVNGCYNNNWKNPFSVQVLFSLHHLSGSYSLPIVRYFLVLKWSIASISHPNHTPILRYITNIHSSLSLLNSFFLPWLSYIYCISAPLWLRSWFANWAPTFLFVDHWIKLGMFQCQLQFHYWMRESKQKKNLPGGDEGSHLARTLACVQTSNWLTSDFIKGTDHIEARSKN